MRLVCLHRALIVVFLCLEQFSSAQQSEAIKSYNIPAGQAVDLWLGVNVKGKLHYVIRSKSGSNSIHAWWVLEPLGRVKQLGTLKEAGVISIPSSSSAAIAAKLRASASVDTTVYVGENVNVDLTKTFQWH